ncbi:poly-glutamine tract binding protein 1 [Cochliomyia hominivorax]
MSLPPALLARLAQRGLVSKQKAQKENEPPAPASNAENEEVIAEDYDEMDTDTQNQQNSEEYQYPSQYDLDHDQVRKPMEDNNWLAQMKARMGEASSAAGYKCCPNKYNIWHKCTLFCINRWGEGIPKPSPEYMKRYKRLIRKYPLPKGWVEMYDPGCGCYYFVSETENLVSWLPPTHPKSDVTKSAAAIRKQMEESTGNEQGIEEESVSDIEDEPVKESAQARHHREVEEIINASLRPKSPRTLDLHEFPSLQEAAGSPTVSLPRKQKSRDLDRALSRQRKERDRNERGERSERDRERYSSHGSSRRHHSRNADSDALDPMDPSAYSDIPRGKWSDGLSEGRGEGERKKKTDEKRDKGDRDSRRSDHSDEDDE